MEQKVPSGAPVVAATSGLRAPTGLRAFVRGNEVGLTLVAAVVGALAGLAAVGIAFAAQFLHRMLFGLAADERLSGIRSIDDYASPWRVFVPVAGGLVIGLFAFLMSRRGSKRTIVDSIEANALHGGRMSLGDSVLLVMQNVLSNGFGASIGLEAGFTQAGGGLASRIGIAFKMRRGDLRILVGSGAAAAIAAAFNAPLTGAFYGFELIIGIYSIMAVAPVVAAALAGTLVARAFNGDVHPITFVPPGPVGPLDYPPTIVLALLASAVGILIMRTVTHTEALFRGIGMPTPLRPVLGGLVLAAFAFVAPPALSAGHGGMHIAFDATLPVAAVFLVLVLKALATAISIGSGFRGGMFFASLFIGSLLGKCYAVVALPLFGFDTLGAPTYVLVGMSAMAVAVIGGPMTMTFLALEMTGDLPVTALVLAAAITTSITVRKTFGYSFATWRFHLRGESIRSAEDIGWIRNLSVGNMMRRDVRSASIETPLKVFRRDFPLGSAQQVVITDRANAYAGIVLVADAYSEEVKDLDATVETLLRFEDVVLLPQMNAREASGTFDRAESEVLVVVDDPEARSVVGTLTESHLLRRYAEELEAQRREVSGDTS